MDNSRFSKITHVADLVICCVWLLLVAHEDMSGWMINPFILLFPELRIWISFLMKRQSKLMIVPIVVLAILASFMVLDRSPRFLLFVGPWETLLTSICALFSIDSINRVELHELLGDVCKNILSIIGYVWLVIYPLAVYIYKRVKKYRSLCLYLWMYDCFVNSPLCKL